MRRGDGTGVIVAFFIAAAILIGGCNVAVRNYQIEDCRDSGGRPITSSILSGDKFWDVKCLEAER